MRRARNVLGPPRKLALVAMVLFVGALTAGDAWSRSRATPGALAPGEMVLEFDDPDVEHDMGCGGTGDCLVAEIAEVVSPSGARIGTAREEVYEITPKVGAPGAQVRARLFFTLRDTNGDELGQLDTDEFVVDAAVAGVVAETGQQKFNTYWDGTVRGTSGIYLGKVGKAHMRGHNVTHLDATTGVILVDEFYNTYVVSRLQ